MLERPVIIIGAPRSGTTILRNCLAQHPDLWHLRAESHTILEGPLDPAPSFESNRCTPSDLNEEVARRLRHAFYRRAINLNTLFEDAHFFFTGRHLVERALLRILVPAVGALTQFRKDAPIRLLEKTPKNSLRVALLNSLFPDAVFVWNKRHPEKNVDSLIAGWHATDTFGPLEYPRYATYNVADDIDIKDYNGADWKFALVPEWRSLDGKKIADVAAWQYRQCNRFALRDFQSIEDDRIVEVHHEKFVRDPLPIVRRIIDWVDLPWTRSVEHFAEALPQVNDTRHADRDDETGLRYPVEVRRALDACSGLDGVVERMGYTDTAS